MVLAANPLNNPAALNVVVIGGVASQGIARVLDSDGRPYDWDKKGSSGSQGATLTYRGWDLSGFKIRFEFWTAAQIDYFENTMVPALAYDATKTAPKPVTIYHPILASRDVNAGVVIKIGPLVDLGAQLWGVTVEFTEFRPPKKKNVTTTPAGASPNAGAGKAATKPTTKDKLIKRAERLKTQWSYALPPRFRADTAHEDQG